MAAGLDSLGAMELRSSLEQSLGVDLPGMLIFDYPSLASIVDFAKGIFCKEEEAIAEDIVEMLDSKMTVGDSLVFVNDLWCSHNFRNEEECRDTICRVPLCRWDNDVPFCMNDSFISGRFFGLLRDVEKFDKEALSLSESEARIMDPQQRMLLSASLTSLCTWKSMVRSTCGVYVGIGPNEYSSTTGAFCEQGVYTATSEAISVGSGRISYTFGLQGPCMTVDTACSASLVASHLSIQSVKNYESSSSISAGVLIIMKQSCQRLQKAGMLSTDGRCKTLDASADGYVRGEGCSLICLDSSELKDTCSLVFAGSAVNQDGRSSSLTAPNGPSQQKVIRKALQTAGKDQTSVALMQMHGTGTSLGDPIETSAAKAVIGNTDKMAQFHRDPVLFFTVKSSIGHSEVGAGVMAIAHSITALEMKKHLPFTHLRNLNPYVQDIIDHDQRSSQIKFARQSSSITGSYPSSDNMLCGISSFAFQGTNAHAIVAAPSMQTAKSQKSRLMLLKEQSCTVIPMWKGMTGCFAKGYGATANIQCMLSGQQLSELVYCDAEKNMFSEWASTTLAMESVNLVAKTSDHLLNNLVITKGLSLEKEELQMASLTLLEASIHLKGGSINIVTGGDCVLTCQVQKSRMHAQSNSRKSRPLTLHGARNAEHQNAIAGALMKGEAEDYICHPAVLQTGFSCLNQISELSSGMRSMDHFASLESIWFYGMFTKQVHLESYSTGATKFMLIRQASGNPFTIAANIKVARQHEMVTAVAGSRVRAGGNALLYEGIEEIEDASRDTLQEIIDIVRDILQCDDLDPEETFFDAGIDSLTSLQLRATLQEKLKMQLPGTLVNDYPTASSLCNMIANTKQYKAIYLPPLYDTDCEHFRQIQPCLPRWYQLLMWPSKKLYESKSGLSFPPQDGVYRVQPLRTSTGPPRLAACSTVDINVAWTRMRSTYYFKGGIGDEKLMKSLSPVLDAFPSFTSRLVERGGDLFFEYGGSDCHVEVRTGFASQWTPQDYVGMIIPGIWRLSIAVWLWQFLYSNIGIAMLLVWRAYTALFGSPLMRIRITHIVKEQKTNKSFWHPWKKPDVSTLTKERDNITGTYLTIDWMHSVADGGTMARFISLWAMSFRNEPLLVSHPGPLTSLNSRQKDLFARLWLNESPVPRLYRPLKGVGLDYIRFLMPNTLIEAIKDKCSNQVRTSDIVVGYMWAQKVRYIEEADKSTFPKITFLADLRQHIPELQPFSGNLIRFLPPLAPGRGTERSSDINISSVSDLVFLHRKEDHFKMSDLEDGGSLSGIPCCWSALHHMIETEKCPMIMVNDLIPFDAPIRFDDDHIGIVPAEASGWRPDIPILCPGILDSFSEIPNWQIWLTRGPDGVVVSLFSFP
jgi:3-oxoacyl-(acyl-carrier-protein) synthase/acyl carrier protein